MSFLLWGMKWLFHPLMWRKKLMDSISGNLGYIIEDGVGLWNLLLGFGLDHLAQPKAQAIEDLGHGTGRGQLLLTIPLLSECLQSGFGRQPRVGQARTKRRVLLRMRIGELTQRFGHLRMPLFPAFAATEGGLRPETQDPCASFGKTHRNSATTPPEDGFGQQGGAPAIL